MPLSEEVRGVGRKEGPHDGAAGGRHLMQAAPGPGPRFHYRVTILDGKNLPLNDMSSILDSR